MTYFAYEGYGGKLKKILDFALTRCRSHVLFKKDALKIFALFKRKITGRVSI